MSSDQYTPNLGEQPAKNARRDAVHVAVAPVVAGQPLRPTDHVGFAPDGRMVLWAIPSVGVVDPYIKEDLEEGDGFWLFLYPGSVTGMRHLWSHPAFTSKRQEE